MSYKSWCYLSFCFLLCAISIFLSRVVGACQIIGLVLFLLDLLCGIYFYVVFSCWTLPVRYLALCFFVFNLLFSAMFLLSSVVEPCPCYTRPFAVSFRSSVSDTILLSSVVDPCMWDTWPCALSFWSSLCDMFVWSSAVEPCLWDGSSPCAVSFWSSLCDTFVWYFVVEVCLWDRCWRIIISFRSSSCEIFLLSSVVEPFLWDWIELNWIELNIYLDIWYIGIY